MKVCPDAVRFFRLSLAYNIVVEKLAALKLPLLALLQPSSVRIVDDEYSDHALIERFMVTYTNVLLRNDTPLEAFQGKIERAVLTINFPTVSPPKKKKFLKTTRIVIDFSIKVVVRA